MVPTVLLSVAIAAAIAKFSQAFPTRQIAQEHPNGLVVCPTSSGPSGTIAQQMIHLNSLARRAEVKTSELLKKYLTSRFDDEVEKEDALSSHWPYVHMLEPTDASVRVAMAEGDEFSWGLLYSDLTLYQLYMESIEAEEKRWADRHRASPLAHLRGRYPTFETVARDLHNVHVKDLVCQLRQIMTSGGVSPLESSTVGASVVQNARDERLSDSRATIILHTFSSDYLPFLLLYTSTYVCSTSQCTSDVMCRQFCMKNDITMRPWG